MKWDSYIIILALILLASCDDIFERDIENEELELFTPREGYVTTDPIIHFWWAGVEGASMYSLQVATPSFYSDEIEELVLDTVLYDTKFEFVFDPDNFEWRVSAFNNISATEYFYGTFQIDSTQNLHDVILINPSQGLATQNESIEFKWQDQDNADSYRFELLKEDELIFSDLLSTNSITIPGSTIVSSLGEGVYTWRVQAQSSNVSPSQYSSREFIVDRTAPGTPVLTKPNNGETFSETPIELTWDRVSNGGSLITDSLMISTDSIFSSDNIILSQILSGTNYNFNPDNATTYWWKVKSYDKAGNEGIYSTIRKFIYSEE